MEFGIHFMTPCNYCILAMFHNEIISKIIKENSQSSLGGKFLVYEYINNKKLSSMKRQSRRNLM